MTRQGERIVRGQSDKRWSIYQGNSSVPIRGPTAFVWKDLWHDEILYDSHPGAFSYVLHQDMTSRISLVSQHYERPLTFHCRCKLMTRSKIFRTLPEIYICLTLCVMNGHIFRDPMSINPVSIMLLSRDLRGHPMFDWMGESKCTMNEN